MKKAILGLALILLLVMACGPGELEPTPAGVTVLEIRSSAFESEGNIPVLYTCDGENISPPLQWEGVPQATESLALIADDPDAPIGTYVHWVMYNIPPDVRQLEEGIPVQETLPNGIVQGQNGARNNGYTGPCPPSGVHRYLFKLYALDTMLDLEPGATKSELLGSMEGHILAFGQLMGRYQR